jgi:hypothetical protein
MDSRVFTFPSLKWCCLQPYTNNIDFGRFFYRHPLIERMGYLHNSPAEFVALSGLPNLRRFEGFIQDFMTLSLDDHPRPIEDLALILFSPLHDVEQETEAGLIDALSKISRTIRRLLLHDESQDWWHNSGMSWERIDAMARICPKLTHLEYPLDSRASKDLVRLCLNIHTKVSHSLVSSAYRRASAYTRPFSVIFPVLNI